MNLSVYKNNPAGWLNSVMHSIDNLWDEQLNGVSKTEKNFMPACDVHENKDYYFFSMDIPGVKKENIQVELKDNTLRISGEKKNEYKSSSDSQEQIHERFYGKFQRSFYLPSAVKEQEIEAHFRNGVLELLVPKTKKEPGRQVPIKDSNKEGLFSRLLNQNKQ